MVWVADGEADARGSRPQDTARGQDRADMSFLEPAQDSASLRSEPSAFSFLEPSAYSILLLLYNYFMIIARIAASLGEDRNLKKS